VDTADLAGSAVTSAKISDLSVGTADLAADAVTSAKVSDGSISLADLNADAVNSAKIVDSSVSLGDLNADSVNSAKIVDSSIVAADLATSSVDSAEIVDASVTATDLAASSVGTSEVIDGSLDGGDLSPLSGTMNVTPATSIAFPGCKNANTTLAGVQAGDLAVISWNATAASAGYVPINTIQDTNGTLKIKWCNTTGSTTSGSPPSTSISYFIIRP
jgi:hypothetical protein